MLLKSICIVQNFGSYTLKPVATEPLFDVGDVLNTHVKCLSRVCLRIIRGNKTYSGNQKNVIKGQRPDMQNRHTQQRILN